MKEEKSASRKEKKKNPTSQNKLPNKYEKDKPGKWSRGMSGPDISEFNDQPILNPNKP
jgi:hypothetical protein